MKRFLWLLAFSLIILGRIYCQEHEVELVIVVDNSGSMAINDPDKLSSRVLKYLPTLLETVQLKITIFKYDSSPTNLGSITRQTSTEEFNEMIEDVNYIGLYTDYARAFKEAYRYLSESEAKEKSIILMTDGELNIDVNEPYYSNYTVYTEKINRAKQVLRNTAYYAKQEGIPVHSLVLSTEIAGEELMEVSQLSEGSFNYVNTKDELDESFSELMSLLLEIAQELTPETDQKETEQEDIQQNIEKVLEEFKKEYVSEEATNQQIIIGETDEIEKITVIETNVINIEKMEYITNLIDTFEAETTNLLVKEIYDRIYEEQWDNIYEEVYQDIFKQFSEETNLMEIPEDCSDLQEQYDALFQNYHSLLYDYKQLNKQYENYQDEIEDKKQELLAMLTEFDEELEDDGINTEEWLEAFEDDPSSFSSQFYMVDYLIEQGNFAQAYGLLSELVAEGLSDDIPDFVYGVLSKGYYFGGKFSKLNALNSEYGDYHYLVPYYNGVMYFKLDDYFRAKTNFLKSIELKSDFYGSQFNLGMIYYEQADYGNAIYRFKQAKAIQPKANVYFMLGNCYYQQELYPQAVTNYLKSVEIDGTQYKPYYNLAIIAMSEQDYLTAHNYLFEAIRHEEDIPELYLLDGYIYYFSGNYFTAFANFQKAVDLGSGIEADVGILLSLLSSDKLDDAYQYVNSIEEDKIIENDILSDLYFTLNLFYNDLDKLEGYLDEYLERDQQSSYYLLGNYYLMNDETDLALEYYEKSVELSQDSIMGSSVLMDVISTELQSSAANREMLVSVVSTLTNDPDITTDEIKLLYQYFLSMRLYDESLDYLSQIMEADTDNREFYLSLFEITFPDKNIENTISDLKSKSENAENMEYLLYFSAFRQSMGMSLLAAEGYQQIIENSEDEDLLLLARKNLAACYLELEKYQDALDIYHDIVNEGEGDEIIFYNMASAYLNLKKMTLAKRYYESAYSIDSQLEEALLNIIAISLYFENLDDADSYLKLANEMEIINQDLLYYYTYLYYKKSDDLVQAAEYLTQLEQNYPDFYDSLSKND